MLIIKIQKNESIEKALKRYKYKVYSTKVIETLRERQYFEKPSVTKRKRKKDAIYREKKKGSLS